MFSKAQLSIFLVIGILIIIGAIYFLTFNVNEKKQEFSDKPQIDLDTNSIKDALQECADMKLESSLDFIALQGGFFRGGTNNILYENVKVQKYLIKDNLNIPGLEIVKSELGELFSEEMTNCAFDYFSSLNENYSFEISENEFTLNENSVSVKIELNANIKLQSRKSITYSDIYTKVENDFLKRYKLIEEFVKNNVENKNGVPLSYLNSYAKENNFNYETFYYNENTVIYFFIFDKNSNPLVWPFAIEYNWS